MCLYVMYSFTFGYQGLVFLNAYSWLVILNNLTRLDPRHAGGRKLARSPILPVVRMFTQVFQQGATPFHYEVLFCVSFVLAPTLFIVLEIRDFHYSFLVQILCSGSHTCNTTTAPVRKHQRFQPIAFQRGPL